MTCTVFMKNGESFLVKEDMQGMLSRLRDSKLDVEAPIIFTFMEGWRDKDFLVNVKEINYIKDEG